jgi:hypothetical protein
VVIGAGIFASSYLGTATTVTRTSTTAETISSGLAQVCSEQVWNTNSSSTNADLPVLLMQPQSTAYVCVTYQSLWQGNASQYRNESFASGPYQFGLYMTKEHCTTTATKTSCTGSTFSNSFIISAPVSFQPSAATDYVTVAFTVSSLSNSTGFYDGSAPFGDCSAMPMAVGYTASQVAASDFAPRVVPSCAIQAFSPSSVSVGGMNVTYIAF